MIKLIYYNSLSWDYGIDKVCWLNDDIQATFSQLLRSGRGEADPVPESGAATAPTGNH